MDSSVTANVVVEHTPPVSPLSPQPPWWRQAASYILAGIAICRKDPLRLLALVALFAIPPLAAAWIGSRPGSVAFWVASALPWITITLGNISMVLAIEALDAGQPLHIFKLIRAAVYWLPRYLWANLITTILFWGIFTPAQDGLGWLAERWGWPAWTPLALLLLPMLFWHVRLVFATYAAIVDNHPGVRSVRISIGIARGRWRVAAAAFAGSVLVEAPIVGPVYLLILQVANPVVAGGFTWALVMLMRPIFIATLHEMYEDYRPPLPAPAKPLVYGSAFGWLYGSLRRL